MDYLRSCYSTQAVFTRDGTSLVDTIRWRFTSSAFLFPGPHRFGSLNWGRNRYGFPAGTLGEVPGAPRIYSTGADPHPLTGSTMCGLEDWYRDGVPLPLRQVGIDATGELACLTGRQEQPPDAEPSLPPAPPGRLVQSWNGDIVPAELAPSGHWRYINHHDGNSYTWLNFLVAHGFRRVCSWRPVRFSPFGGGFSDLECVAWDRDTQVSTWLLPPSPFYPAGSTVTIYPG